MLSGISWPQLLIVLVIVLAIFGTKRFRSFGSDIGNAVKGFRSAMTDAEETKEELSDNSGEDADFENTPVEENRKDT
jgi:sec-independent protein translocase protein TatA